MRGFQAVGRPKTNPDLLHDGRLSATKVAALVAAEIGVPDHLLVPDRPDIAQELQLLTPQGVTNRFNATNLGDSAVSSLDTYHFVNRQTCKVYDGRKTRYEDVVREVGGTLNLIPVLELPPDGGAAALLQQHIDATPMRRKEIGEYGKEGGRGNKKKG